MTATPFTGGIAGNEGNAMSITYWVFKRFGILIALFYIAVVGILVFSYYQSGMTSPDRLALFYPAGGAYARTTKNGLIRRIYGFPPAEDDAVKGTESVEILSYNDDGATVRLDGRNQRTVTTNDVVRHLINRDSAALESGMAPLQGPFNYILTLHLEFLRGMEQSVGGTEQGSLRRLILPKAAISAIYLGLAFLAWWLLGRMDRISSYKGGYSLAYGSFVLWPIAVILVSFAGVNVVHVARHLPDSYYFMHWYVMAGWAAMFAWPAAVILLSLLDIVKALSSFEFSRALAHAGVLAAGILTVPLVAVGVLFAILVVAMYFGLRIGKRVLLPESWQRRLGGILGR